jgi:hypothetical protein
LANAAKKKPKKEKHITPMPVEKPVGWVGIIGFIISVLSLVVPGMGAIVCASAAIGVSAVGIYQNRHKQRKLRGFAIAGLVIGIIALIILLVYIFIYQAATS